MFIYVGFWLALVALTYGLLAVLHAICVALQIVCELVKEGSTMTESTVLKIDELRALAAAGQLTKSVAKKQVRLRQKLAQDCVGWLYPSILASEITEIHELAASTSRRVSD